MAEKPELLKILTPLYGLIKTLTFKSVKGKNICIHINKGAEKFLQDVIRAAKKSVISGFQYIGFIQQPAYKS